MKKLILNLKFIIACFKVIKDLKNTDLVISAAQEMNTPERFAESTKKMATIPGAQEIIAAKRPFPKINLQQLIKLPESTFGHKYAAHMIKNKLDPEFFKADYDDDISYQFYFYGQVHDFWHVLSGFDTSEEGEVGVLAFTFAQLQGPGTVLIIGLALIHSALFHPEKSKLFFEKIVKGWNLGLQAKPFFTLDWMNMMNLPYSEARAMVNLPAATA